MSSADLAPRAGDSIRSVFSPAMSELAAIGR
jgi:hypothetical protein